MRKKTHYLFCPNVKFILTFQLLRNSCIKNLLVYVSIPIFYFRKLFRNLAFSTYDSYLKSYLNHSSNLFLR